MRTDNIRAHYDPEQTTVIHCSYKVGASSFLGRHTEKKSFDSLNIKMQHFPKFSPYRRGTPPSKDLEIHRNLFPAGYARIRYHAQINPLAQNAVGTPQATDYNFQPARHKPGGYQAVRINVLSCSEKTFHASLPSEKSEKQCADHGRCRVQHIRDQLVRKQGKGHILLTTQISGDWNPFFPENRENFDDIAFVRGNLPVTIVVAADRAGRSNYLRKINLALVKRFFIFPDTLECVNKRQLYRFTALSSRKQVFGSETLWSASLRRVVIFLRSISYLDNLPSFISLVTLLCKNFISQFDYSVSNNSRSFFQAVFPGAWTKF